MDSNLDVHLDSRGRGLVAGKWVAGGFPTTFYTGSPKLGNWGMKPELHGFGVPTPEFDTSNITDPLGGLSRIDLFPPVPGLSAPSRDEERGRKPDSKGSPVNRSVMGAEPQGGQGGPQQAGRISSQEKESVVGDLSSRPAGPNWELARKLFIVEGALDYGNLR